ncbi:Ig-like domain-containing protein [Dokdonella ginsengisoli]|uniref:Ig-like domain-containing protein n=1 Tax=Dokdonella ginsengisoli TaxID=363846 RepID=A0ABV9QRG2_9GAMM
MKLSASSTPARAVARAAFSLLACGCAAAATAKGVLTAALPDAPAATPTQVISTPDGPLWQIHLGNELSAQIAHIGDISYQTYPPGVAPGDFGTFLVVGDQLYAPDFAGHGQTATGNIGPYTPFTPQSQSAVTGTGSELDPYKVVTVVRAGNTGLELTQVDTYVHAYESYRTDVTIRNTGTSTVSAILYRAMDCYLGGSDAGYGRVDGNKIACKANPTSGAPDRIQQFVPLSGSASYYEAHYSQVWEAIGTHQPFNNTCPGCTQEVDNGMGISWNVAVPAGGSATRSHLTLLTVGDTATCGPTTVSTGILPLTAGMNQPIFFSARASIHYPFTGTMTFLADAGSGASIACSTAMSDVSASCRHTLAPGIYQVVAQYSGDGFNPPGCSPPQTVAVVNGDPTDPTVISVLMTSPNAMQGQPVTLTASIVAAGGARLAGAAPLDDGYVTFALGDNELADRPIAGGAASYTTVFPGGSFPITARYSGNAQYIANQDTVTVQVSTPQDGIFYGGFDFGVPPQ